MAPVPKAVTKTDESFADLVSKVTAGPDLNESKGPLDKKLYRQIMLPNGMRCVLIQDTLALQQASLQGGLDDPDSDEDDSDAKEVGDVDMVGEADVDMTSATEGNDETKTHTHHRHHPHHHSEFVSAIDDVNASHDEDDEDHCHDDGGEGIRDAAAAILVGTGSFYDPINCQGLAHFLEHLLFMGSEKYPVENEYESFVSRHGGSDNAYTEWEYTVYSLEIPQEYLWPALDRLAQFFIAPLLGESSVDRELNAIESEFKLNLRSDANRWDQLVCATSSVDHPFAKFAWGNLKSLRELPATMGVNPLKELRTFFDRYYYAANMRLVVMGAYSLDEMQAKVMEQFADVPSLPRDWTAPFKLPVKPEAITSWDSTYLSPIVAAGFPLKPDRGLCKIFRIVPVREKHTLSITWQIPPVESQWRSKPADYISHLMGHEAEGSLLSFLRSKSLAVSCMVGVGDGGSDRSSCHALLVASFVLSEKGLREWHTIVEAVYQYIGMLRQYCRQPEGLPEWIYEELKRTHEISYRFRDEPSPDDVVDSIVGDMAPHSNLPPERLLDASSLLFDFDHIAVQNLLETYLNPSAARIDFMSSAFGKLADYGDVGIRCEASETIINKLIVLDEREDGTFDASATPPQVEPMFDTPFWCHSLPAILIEKWASLALPQMPTIDIHLPPRNQFVPTNLDLKPLPEDDSDHPLLNASIKLCIPVGKTKQWFPATVIRYNQKLNTVLLSYEDEAEKWHTMDTSLEHFPKSDVLALDSFEGSIDAKMIKYRVVALSIPGKGPIRMYGDESDVDAMEGTGYPAIPPPSTHLPKEISNTNTLKMWWLQDRNFKRPIADFRLQFNCAKANATPLHRACADLYQCICVDALTETSYLASMCELWMGIDVTEVGFSFRFHGFDANLLNLFETTMRLVLSFRGRQDSLPEAIEEERFAACLEVLRRSYKNAGLRAAGLSSYLRVQALRPNLWSSNKMLKAIEGLDVSVFAKTMSSIFEDFAVEALYHGNVTRDDANKAREMVLDLLKAIGGTSLSRKRYPSQAVTRVPYAESVPLLTVPAKDPSEPNTACEIYIQVGKDDIRDRTLMDLIIQLMHEPFFDQLRTKDQFGYSVYCSSRWSYGIIGCIFHITTNVKSAAQSMERVDRFLTDYRQELVDMSHDAFVEHQVALAKEKLDMFNSMSEQTDSLWNEIREGRFEWEVWRDEAIHLKTLKKEDIIAAFDEWLRPGKPRRIFATQVIGAGETNASVGRPQIDHGKIEEFYDKKVEEFHSTVCKKQTCGRVNSKLF